MSEIETQELQALKRRASDQPKVVQTLGALAGIGMGCVAFYVGMFARESDAIALAGFLAVMFCSSMLDFEQVKSLMPGKKE